MESAIVRCTSRMLTAESSVRRRQRFSQGCWLSLPVVAFSGAASQHLRVAILKFLVEFAEGRDLRRADESEVLRPEEIHLPLVLEVLVADGLKRLSLFEAHGSLEGINGELLSNT